MLNFGHKTTICGHLKQKYGLCIVYAVWCVRCRHTNMDTQKRLTQLRFSLFCGVERNGESGLNIFKHFSLMKYHHRHRCFITIED